MLAPFSYGFVQRGVAEVLLLSLGAGLLGTWIVARGLAFYSHAVAAAAFPGLVLAAGLGFAPLLGALGSGAIFALGVGQLSTRRAASYDALTALALAGALALGIVLASDVFHSGANVDTLLFGSLLALGPRDLLVAAGVAAAALAGSTILGPRWLAVGFDAEAARAAGVRSRLPDLALLALVAMAAVAALAAVGALLATAILVVPAVTARLWTDRVATWQPATVALAAAEGVAGIWLSVQTNAPPGAAIATLGGAVFALAALAKASGIGRAAIARGRRSALAALAALLAAGCGASAPAHPGALDVVATTTQLGDVVRQVGGPDVNVHQILQPNTDPHEYEPRPADVISTHGARLVVESGDGLDGWMGKVLREAGGRPAVLTIAPEHIPFGLAGDPHWWHDPRNMEAATLAVRDALARAAPAHGSAFGVRAADYVAKLRALDSGIRSCVARVPASRRKLVTSHDAFDYFARRYGIAVVGAVIPSQTSEAQPSAGQIAKLARLVKANGVEAVFPESSLNSRLAEAIAAQTGARADTTLYGDTLGPKGSAGATYLGMERANAVAMAAGFTRGAVRCTIGL